MKIIFYIKKISLLADLRKLNIVFQCKLECVFAVWVGKYVKNRVLAFVKNATGF